MEKIGLAILILLAISYVGVMVVLSIAMLPFGIVPLLVIFALSLFFLKTLASKINNPEDDKYNERCEP